MPEPQPNPLTQLLVAAAADTAARDKLFAAVYAELQAMARAQLHGDGVARHVQPTMLVHESYMRLFGHDHIAWANRRMFYAAFAETMRRVRVDVARAAKRDKRGGGKDAVALDGAGACADIRGDAGPQTPDRVVDVTDVLALEEALPLLEREDRRKYEIVKLRYYAGLTVDETAAALGISARAVDSDWRFARARLRQLMLGDSARSVDRQ